MGNRDRGVTKLVPSAVASAPLLLGSVLSHHSDEGTVAIEITEVEAYEGQRDPASHAYRGLTNRNRVMFGPPGHLYVYAMHGHHCCNVVTSPAGDARAVLLRAGRIVEGIELARERRPGVRDDWLARGPGCLTRAMAITMPLAGSDLFGADSAVRLELRPTAESVRRGPRVGVSRAAEDDYRFWINGDPSVSAYKRSPRAE